MYRRPLVIALCWVFSQPPTVTRADEYPVIEMKSQAPDKYAPLVWKFGEKLSPGYWYSNEQVVRIDARITYLEKKASKDCVDAQVDSNKEMGPWWKVIVGVLVGVGIGYCAGSSKHCGLAK